MDRAYRYIAVALAGILLVLMFQQNGWSATAESKYYAAERCAAQLSKSPKLQQYRDRWLRCIKKYLAVYRHDPHGPWAAAGLYRAGMLYGDLYKKSYLQDDRLQALDLLDKVVKYFPKSRYNDRARKAYAELSNGSAPAAEQEKSSDVEKWYEQARKNDQRLERKTSLQKYRDQWFKSIDLYRKVVQNDEDDALVPGALYGMAKNYAGMYKWSRSDLDLLQSQKTFQELIDRYPQSPFAQKAREELGETETVTISESSSNGDDIANVIRNADTAGPAEQATAVREITSQQPTIVQGLRFWSNPRYTRVVIDADADTIFTYHELREDPSIGKPQRIYIDVHNSRLSKDLQKVVPINDNLLSDARAGQYNNDTVRVVVDIKSSETFKIFSLKNPFRIVLDVWGGDVDTPSEQTAKEPVVAETNSSKLPPSAIVKQLALGVKRIVVDPGHGGKDYGAPGYYKGTHEKRVVLEIGKRLAKMIETQLKCDVVMTRKTDTYLSLEERTAIANTQNADLFISIHTNASPNKKAYGMETFILNLATDDEAIRVAARENATSTKNISDLDTILKDLMHNAKVSESTRLASYVQQGAYKRLKRKYGSIRNKGVKKAPFYVLLGADMPSILVETAFISNARECKRLTSSAYQELLCQGIVDGIKRYVQETNPMAMGSPESKKGKQLAGK